METEDTAAELGGVNVHLDAEQIATVTFSRPPNNFFDP